MDGVTREEYIERLRNTPIHLCRLRHFDINRRNVAFYIYSDEEYSSCIYPNGDWFGAPEEAFDILAIYLNRQESVAGKEALTAFPQSCLMEKRWNSF
jgi:hypothetical protein